MECPRCKSVDVRETEQIWIPEGMKAFKCGNCYSTWLVDSQGVKSIQEAIDYHVGIDYEKVRGIVREEIDRAITRLLKVAKLVAEQKKP